jgi:hypothetical protein
MKNIILTQSKIFKFICYFQLFLSAIFIYCRQDDDSTFLATFFAFLSFLLYINFLKGAYNNGKQNKHDNQRF